MTTLCDLKLDDLIEWHIQARRRYQDIVNAAEKEYNAAKNKIDSELLERIGVEKGDKVTVCLQNGTPTEHPGFCDGAHLEVSLYDNSVSYLMNFYFIPAAKKNPDKKNMLGATTFTIRQQTRFEIRKRE